MNTFDKVTIQKIENGGYSVNLFTCDKDGSNVRAVGPNLLFKPYEIHPDSAKRVLPFTEERMMLSILNDVMRVDWNRLTR